VLNKCTFKEAIQLVAEGVLFIEGYYPLSFIRQVQLKEINPFDAYEQVIKNKNREFIPNYKLFASSFKTFLMDFIKSERKYVFEQLIQDPKKYAKQLLVVSNLYQEIRGIDMDFSQVIAQIVDSEDISINQFRHRFIEQVKKKISNLLMKKEKGVTNIFKLKKMKNTPFSKYFDEIIALRRKEFENANIKRIENKYDISELLETYYGQKFSNVLNLGLKKVINPPQFLKIKQYAEKLNLKLNIHDTEN
jgi:hypothetical protein